MQDGPRLISRMFAAYVALKPKLGRGLGLGLHDRLYRLARRWLDPQRVELDGFALYLDPYDDVLSYNLARGYPWEEAETRVFRSLLREGMDVLDVGAHIGYYTLLASRAVGPRGRVFAFEPAPGNLALLRKNVSANGCSNVHVVDKAVGAACGRSTLLLDPRNTGGHSLGGRSRAAAGALSVEVVDLDGWIEASRARPAVLKIDVEGGEAAVLEGLRRTLTRAGPLAIMLELFPERLASSERSPHAMLELLVSHRFGLRVIEHGAGPSERLAPRRVLELAAERRLVNLLCERER